MYIYIYILKSCALICVYTCKHVPVYLCCVGECF